MPNLNLDDLDIAEAKRQQFEKHVRAAVHDDLEKIRETATNHELADQRRHAEVLRAIEGLAKDPPTRGGLDTDTPSAVLARAAGGAISRVSRAAVGVPWPVWVVVAGVSTGTPAVVEYGFQALGILPGVVAGGAP